MEFNARTLTRCRRRWKPLAAGSGAAGTPRRFVRRLLRRGFHLLWAYAIGRLSQGQSAPGAPGSARRAPAFARPSTLVLAGKCSLRPPVARKARRNRQRQFSGTRALDHSCRLLGEEGRAVCTHWPAELWPDKPNLTDAIIPGGVRRSSCTGVCVDDAAHRSVHDRSVSGLIQTSPLPLPADAAVDGDPRIRQGRHHFA